MPRPANPVVRSRLLLAGRDLIHQRGFNGCGVQDITAQAGVPKGSFYNYFDSKEALVIEVLDQYWSAIDARHGLILSNLKMKPLLRIKRFFEGLVDDHRERGFSGGCLIGNVALELSDTSEAARTKIKTLFLTWERMLADCLEDAQRRGDLNRNSNVKELAALLVEAYEGAVMRGKLQQDGRPCERFVQRVLPALLAG